MSWLEQADVKKKIKYETKQSPEHKGSRSSTIAKQKNNKNGLEKE